MIMYELAFICYGTAQLIEVKTLNVIDEIGHTRARIILRAQKYMQSILCTKALRVS